MRLFKRRVVSINQAIILFILAGLAEIGGGYLIWQWLREGRPLWYGIIGGIVLVVYGIIPTFQKFPSFGRVNAAYGGVFIVLALLWGWGIDKKTPDLYDWIGAVICLIGVTVILLAPRH
jgi:small multidrug resistance family-3 protein